MKLNRTLGLLAVCSLPLFAAAAPPISPESLGHVDATISFCAKVDSKSADKYKDMGKAIVSGMSEKDLVNARTSNEYKDSFDSIMAELEKIPADKAVEACHAALQK